MTAKATVGKGTLLVGLVISMGMGACNLRSKQIRSDMAHLITLSEKAEKRHKDCVGDKANELGCEAARLCMKQTAAAGDTGKSAVASMAKGTADETQVAAFQIQHDEAVATCEKKP